MAHICAICRQTFMCNARPPIMYLHVQTKHAGTTPTDCFPVELKDYDPNNPDGVKAAAPAATGPIKPKKVKKKDDGLDALLDAGMSKGKKK
jgi:hypothetical protein